MTIISTTFYKLNQVISPAEIHWGGKIDFTSGIKEAQCHSEKGFTWEKCEAWFPIFHIQQQSKYECHAYREQWGRKANKGATAVKIFKEQL